MSYLFKKLIIKNFVTHRHTEINLDKSSILLISGANGSGKSLILDGFALVTGGFTERLKSKPLRSFVGPFANEARIKLILNNFMLKDEKRRVISVYDPQLNSIIDKDIIEIETIINSKGIREFKLNGKKVYNGRRITKQDILTIFRSINSSGNTPLFVTEQGTINSFANLSPHRKFELFLKTTNLEAYLNKILEAERVLRQANSQMAPLYAALQEEERKLNLYKNAYENYLRKKALIEKRKKLETELLWARVLNLEQIVETLKKQHTEKMATLNTLNHRISDIETELSQYDNQIKEVEHLNKQINNEISKSVEKKMRLEGQKEVFLNELEKYKIKSIRTSSLSDKKNEYYRLIKKLNKELIDLQKKLKRIRNEKDRLNSQLEHYQKQLSSRDNFIDTLTYIERTLLLDALSFKKKIVEKEFDDEVIGPIFSLIKIKSGFEKWEKAVKIALRWHLYNFLALTESGYVKAKKLYDEWPGRKPNVTVIKFTQNFIQRPKKIDVPYVFDYAVNLLEGDNRVLSYLKRTVHDLVAYDHKDPNILTNVAKTLKTNIITFSGNVQYLREMGFRKPPIPYKISLGKNITDLSAENISEDLRDLIRSLQIKIHELFNDEVQLSSRISEIRKELKILEETHMNKEDSIDIHKRIYDLEGKVIAIDNQVSILQDKINSLMNDSTTNNQKLTYLHEQKKSLENELQMLLTEKGILENDIRNIIEQIEKAQNELIDFKKQAEMAGPRPEIIRTFDKVQEEINRIEGMISVLVATEDDKLKYESQKKRIEEIKEYLQDRKKHIENLRKDLELRLKNWSSIVHDLISKIRDYMFLLLKNKFSDVRIYVKNIEHPEHAELFIEVSDLEKSQYKSYGPLSGGEEVLVTEAFILALHIIKGTPVHIIDEITQRLDDTSRGFAFDMVIKASQIIKHNNHFYPQFILMTPTIIGLKIPNYIHHIVFIKTHLKNRPVTIIERT